MLTKAFLIRSFFVSSFESLSLLLRVAPWSPSHSNLSQTKSGQPEQNLKPLSLAQILRLSRGTPPSSQPKHTKVVAQSSDFESCEVTARPAWHKRHLLGYTVVLQIVFNTSGTPRDDAVP